MPTWEVEIVKSLTLRVTASSIDEARTLAILRAEVGVDATPQVLAACEILRKWSHIGPIYKTIEETVTHESPDHDRDAV